MDFHGAVLSRSWVKLGATAAKGTTAVVLAEGVDGWRVGDRVILTATHRQKVPDEGKVPSARNKPETEERTIRSIDGTKLTLDSPLAFNHDGERRVQLREKRPTWSRNVTVESAEPGRRAWPAITRCITGTRQDRFPMPSFGTSEKLESSASTAFISIASGTRCGGRRWWVHRSGIVATAG